MGQLISNPITPYVGPISGGSFTPKKYLKFQATVPINAYGFDINLQCGPNTFPHDDIALQISVRLLNGYIDINYMEDGICGKETRLPNVFIEANKKFEIIVLIESNQYKICINNEHLCDFPQTIPCEKITHVSIDGDISIIQIYYQSLNIYIAIILCKLFGVVVLYCMLIIFIIALFCGLIYWRIFAKRK